MDSSASSVITFPLNGDKNGYLTLAELSKETGYHPVYLRRLLLDGKIKGIKIGMGSGPGFWVTTLEAIQEYQEHKDTRGRPVTTSGSNHRK